ncbi:MAG: energy transducer TonB [Cytophagales bacterium]|nr:MAG: energy transducer TonB [Cytophagales bacterium]
MISYILFFGSLFTIVALYVFIKIQRKNRLENAIREFEHNPDGVFTVVEKNASPSGGFEAFYRFVAANMHYPLKAKDAGVEGRIYMSFIVEKDGSLSDIYAVKGIGFGCDEEAVRVIESHDNYWTPAQIKGQAARQKLVIPIIFKLDKKN